MDWRTPLTPAALAAYVRDGGLRADVIINDRQLRFDDRGENWVGNPAGQGQFRRLPDGRYHYVAPDGARYVFAPVATGSSAMIEPASGVRFSYAHIVEARFADGEILSWKYEAQEAKQNCGPKGRFGLTNPDCRVDYYSRPIEIMSSRGMAVKLTYASNVAGRDFNRLREAMLYDQPRCAKGAQCNSGRLLRTVKMTGSTMIPR